jgi:nucleoside-diphosphate-sugar epimerase
VRFPGSLAAYDALYQVTDAELLGRATVWAGSEPAADGEVYNVTNGDQLRWRHLWPLFAAHLGMSYAEPQPVPPAEAMADRRDVWERLATRHDLIPIDYADRVVGWEFGEFIRTSGFDNVSSTMKLRRAGFTGCLDTGPVRGRRAACPRTE